MKLQPIPLRRAASQIRTWKLHGRDSETAHDRKALAILCDAAELLERAVTLWAEGYLPTSDAGKGGYSTCGGIV